MFADVTASVEGAAVKDIAADVTASTILSSVVPSPTGITRVSPTMTSPVSKPDIPIKLLVPVVSVMYVPESVTSSASFTSAVKSSFEPPVAAICACLTFEKLFVTIAEIVKSVLPLFSTICDVSLEFEEVIFSPLENVPLTDTKVNPVPLVAAKANPVAPDVTPVIFEPAAIAGLGVPSNVMAVNIFTSKRYNLNSLLLPAVSDKKFVLSVPLICSIALALATPIFVPAAVPRVEVAVSCKFIVLYGVTLLAMFGETSGIL